MFIAMEPRLCGKQESLSGERPVLPPRSIPRPLADTTTTNNHHCPVPLHTPDASV